MAEKKLPEKLLIYSIIDKYCIDVILKNRFVVTDPTKGFNDTLDCYFEFEFAGLNKERIVEHLMGLFISKKGKILSDLTRNDHDKINYENNKLNSLSEDILKKELSDYSTKIVRESFSNFLRIRCFSALNEKKTLNNVIFSHYGDSHKGLCYIFDQKKLIPIQDRESLTEVKYCFKPASVEFKDQYSQEDLDQIGRDMIGIKHHDWGYENEWRLKAEAEFPNKIYETMGFPPNALEGIVLGIKATKKDKERIIKLVEKRTAKVKVFQASRIFGSFELEYENNPIFE